MKSDVLITVRGEQYYDGADPDETELITEGTLEPMPDGWRVVYEETELTGMAGTQTVFELHDRSALLIRRGGVSSEMRFEVGKPHTSFYETPFGSLNVEIHTQSLRGRMTERGGLIDIRYHIAVEHQVTGKNRFRIHIKTKDRGIAR